MDKKHLSKLEFEQLFRQYYKELVLFAQSYLKSAAEAEEVVQDVFVGRWENRDTLTIHHSERAFLYTAVRNQCLNHLKHNKVRDRHAVFVAEHSDIQNAPTDEKELSALIAVAIANLPPKCREIFELSRFDGLKYKEIAEQLGISEKTVENQMGKALKMMRDQLSDFMTLALPWMALGTIFSTLVGVLSLLVVTYMKLWIR